MILFVGQVPRAHTGRAAFQELDYSAVFGSMTKWAAQVDDAARIPSTSRGRSASPPPAGRACRTRPARGRARRGDRCGRRRPHGGSASGAWRRGAEASGSCSPPPNGRSSSSAKRPGRSVPVPTSSSSARRTPFRSSHRSVARTTSTTAQVLMPATSRLGWIRRSPAASKMPISSSLWAGGWGTSRHAATRCSTCRVRARRSCTSIPTRRAGTRVRDELARRLRSDGVRGRAAAAAAARGSALERMGRRGTRRLPRQSRASPAARRSRPGRRHGVSSPASPDDAVFTCGAATSRCGPIASTSSRDTRRSSRRGRVQWATAFPRRWRPKRCCRTGWSSAWQVTGTS